MAISLLAYLATFSGQLYFRRRYIFGESLFSKKLYFRRNFIFGEALFYSFIFGEVTSSHFFRATTSTKQLHFWSSYFFREAAFFDEIRFSKSYFLAVAAVIFSEYLFFGGKTSTEQPLLENRKFFRVVTFRNSYFFGRRIT